MKYDLRSKFGVNSLRHQELQHLEYLKLIFLDVFVSGFCKSDHVCVHACMYVCIHTCVHIYICMCACTFVYIIM